MRTKKAASEDVAPMRPTLSPEVRENQMISLAMDLVEKRLLLKVEKTCRDRFGK